MHGLLLLAALCTAFATARVSAQSAEVGQAATPSSRVLLVSDGDEARGAFVLTVERAEQRALGELGLSISKSLVPFRDAQLAAGCTGSVRSCGTLVAQALDSEELLVSTVEEEASAGRARLTLHRFAARAPVRSGTAQLSREPASELAASVQALVDSLYSERAQLHAPATPLLVAPVQTSAAIEQSLPARELPPPAASNVADPAPDYARRRTVLRAIGWPSLAVGVGLLAGGLALTASSGRDGEAYYAVMADTRDQVDTKIAHKDSAEDKASTARILYSVGAASAAAGLFTLLWGRFALRADRKLHSSTAKRGREQQSSVRIFAAPVARGFSLNLTSRL